MVAINQHLVNTTYNVRLEPISNCTCSSYLQFSIINKVNLAKFWWNNTTNKMANLTLYSEGRIEASHSDLITAKDNDLG